MPPLRHKKCYQLQANDGKFWLRPKMLIWSVYMCKLLWGGFSESGMKVITRVEYDVGLLAKQVCKLNVNKRRKPKANVAKPETKTPSIVALCFRPKVSIVVHRKKAIEISTKKKTGFRRQSMLLISYIHSKKVPSSTTDLPATNGSPQTN